MMKSLKYVWLDIMKKILIRITEEEHSKLKLFSFLTDKSMNFVVRSLIQQFLIEKKEELKNFKKN